MAFPPRRSLRGLTMTDHLPESPEVAPSADHLTSKWRDASAAARKAEHHWPADCLAEAADVVDRLNAQAAEHEREVAGLRTQLAESERMRDWNGEASMSNAAKVDHFIDRAEAAERALAHLRAGIEALIGRLQTDEPCGDDCHAAWVAAGFASALLATEEET